MMVVKLEKLIYFVKRNRWLTNNDERLVVIGILIVTLMPIINNIIKNNKEELYNGSNVSD